MFSLLLALTAADAAPTTYDLSAADGRLYVIVRAERGGLFGALGHDHVVVASRFTGRFTWDPEAPEACAVSIDVPVDGLVVDPGSAREWAGLDGTTSDGDKAAIRDNLRGERQLFAEAHPAITWRATGCAVEGERVAVTGDLSIRGVTRRLTVPMSIRADGAHVTASGQVELTHTAFGFEPYRALAGALRNQDRLSLVVDVRGAAPAAVGQR
jgi:polyisoprenoid-binding protein YceI